MPGVRGLPIEGVIFTRHSLRFKGLGDTQADGRQIHKQ
jgi:hypothetical protein